MKWDGTQWWRTTDPRQISESFGEHKAGFPNFLNHLRCWILLQGSCRANEKIQGKGKEQYS